MRAFQIAGLLLTIMSAPVFAQFNVGFTLSNDIPVIKGSDTISMAWAGGMNNPQFSPLNFLPSAGDELFSFDRDGALFKGFQYNALNKEMIWVPYMDSIPFGNHFPKLTSGKSSFCLLRDYNGDGKPDIFSGTELEGIAAYENVGAAFPEFELRIPRLRVKVPGGYRTLSSAGNKLPEIRDLDEDGDLDFLIFSPGNMTGVPNFHTVVVFENMGMDDYGTPDSFLFIVGNGCWGKVGAPAAPFDPTNWQEYDCDGGNGNVVRDITSTHAMHDINGDGKLDLLITSDHHNSIFSMNNIGTNEFGEIDLATMDTNFPVNDIEVSLANEPYPYFLDIDNDGDDDMLIGANHYSKYSNLEYDTSGTILTDLLYRNNGSDSEPKFELEGQGYISRNMIDVGIRSFPAFGDLTGDGLPDMVVGNSGYSVFNPDLSPAFLQYYKNLGSKEAPVYKLVNTNFAEVNLLNLYIAHPTLGDLDDDGDLDMVVGDGQGYIHIYENTGSATALYFELKASKYKNIHLQGEAHPQLFDMNSDGMLDLIIGDGSGKIHYFENDGSDTEFDFDQNPTITKMGGLDLFKTRGGMTCPYFTRNLDSTNLLYLFVGTEDGIINGYGPITDFGGDYTLVDSIVVEAHQTSITGLNLFGDKRDELCVGQRSGGLYLLNRTNNITIGMSHVVSKRSEIRLQPNPTHDQTLVKMQASSKAGAQMRVTDIQGNVISEKHINPTNGYYNENIDLRGFPRGVYLVSVVENDAVSWAKLVLE
ncbi:MAG: FG-GAP-like repeat-containing protein [Flavobacteriales bacterium]